MLRVMISFLHRAALLRPSLFCMRSCISLEMLFLSYRCFPLYRNREQIEKIESFQIPSFFLYSSMNKEKAAARPDV